MIDLHIVCAWCGTVLKTGTGPTSHGICVPCAALADRGFSAEAIRQIRANESDEDARKRVEDCKQEVK